MVDPGGTSPERVSMRSPHALKVGLFGANCSSGRAVTKVAERWSGSWDDSARLALLAESCGLEFMLPIGRWKGYGGETNYQGATLETIAWACGLLAVTRQITVFATVHAPLFPPIIAAKQFVTADHIGKGRFGLNIVCGWNEGEFDMFGVSQREHGARYEYAQEWLDAVNQMWSNPEPFDFDGQFLHLKNVQSLPKPYGGSRPLLMNAGASPVGKAFAIRNCDALFLSTNKDTFETTTEEVNALKQQARQQGREIDVYTVGAVSCRPTAKEAEDYYRWCTFENADWAAIDHVMAMRGHTRATLGPEEFERRRRHTAHGLSGLPLIGDPDSVTADMGRLAAAGLRGIALSMTNYADELPFFAAEVLPRLERLGLRSSS